MRVPLLTSAVAVSLAGAVTIQSCSGGPSAPPAATRPVIALVMKSLANEFFKTMEDGATKHQAAHAADYELVATGIKDEQDVARQIAIVEQMIARRVNAIVLAPADSKALVGVVKRAVDAGVAVVNIDNRLDRDAMAERGLTVPFVGPDNRKGAAAVGAYVATRLEKGDPIAILEGAPNAFNGIQRRLGFEDAAREAGLVIARSQTAYWETARANQVVTALVTERPDVKAILCANDSMALGAVAALKSVGPRRTGAGRRVRQHLRRARAHHGRRHDRHRRSARRSARRLRYRIRARTSPRTGDGAGRSRDTGRSRHRGEAPLSKRPRSGLDALGLLVVLLALSGGFGLVTSHFLTWTTALALANQAPDTLLVATGMTLVIITGGIDLSAGSVLALSGAIFGLLLTSTGMPLAAAMFGALADGRGLRAGERRRDRAMAPALVSRDAGDAGDGARRCISRHALADDLSRRARGRHQRAISWRGSRRPCCSRRPWSAAASSSCGEWSSAGSSSPSARTKSRRTWRASRPAACAWPRSRLRARWPGLAAVVQAGRLAAVDPNAGTGLELEAIAAVVIGGASLTGGRGSAVNSALGALIILVLGAGLAQMGVQEPTRRLVTGAVIVGLRYPRSLSRPRKDRSMTQPAIVVVGSLNADLVVHVPRFPVAGETISGDGFVVLPGGKGANQACAAGRLGGQVAMVGQVGA